MLKEIMITTEVVAAWAIDTNGAKTITDIVPIEIFGRNIPADENLEGKTAADIGWKQLGAAPITADHRF